MTPTPLPDLFVVESKVYEDQRGFFLESYNQRDFERMGIDVRFVQDNHSRSAKGVLRGLHYQIQNPQGKLVRVIVGEVYDVAVDLRSKSPTFGKWFAIRLSASNKKQMYVSPGFAHGFLVLSDFAELIYKTTDFYAPQHERCVIWNDPVLKIDWPLDGVPVLSEKDASGVLFDNAEHY